MSTTHPTATGRPRLRAATLIAGGISLGLACAAVLLRQGRHDIPTVLIAAIAGALTVAVVLAIIWRDGGLRGSVTITVPPARRPSPRPVALTAARTPTALPSRVPFEIEDGR